MSEESPEQQVVQHEWKELPLKALRMATDNPNSMDSRIVVRLKNALDRFGFVQNLVVMPSKKHKGQYIIVGGNHRYEVLSGAENPPETVMCCVIPTMSKAERHLLAQALNRIQGSDSREEVEALYESLIGSLGADVVDETVGHLHMVQRMVSKAEKEAQEAVDNYQDDDEEDAPMEKGVQRIKKIKPNTILHSRHESLQFPKNSIDAFVTDPPYMVGIFENDWDKGEGACQFTLDWVTRHLRALKPGGYLCIFINSRQYDLIVQALRRCKLIIRDPLLWIRYISKIPGKRLNKEGTVYTTLKNGYEMVAVAQKPPEGTFKENYKKYGVGGFFFDDALLPYRSKKDRSKAKALGKAILDRARAGKIAGRGHRALQGNTKGWIMLDGRRPSNVVVLPVDGSVLPLNYKPYFVIPTVRHGSKESQGHETQKRVDLIQWVTKLVTPQGGLVADFFAGSGTLGVAAMRSGRNFLLIEQKKSYYETSVDRLEKEYAERSEQRSAKC